MALILKDRVKVTTTTTGTGTLSLDSAVSGFQSFSAIGDGNTTYYTITDASGNWEVGLGTYSSSGNALARTTVLSSSNGGAAVNFGAGSKTVFGTYPAGKSVSLNSSGVIDIGVGGTGLSSPGTSGNVLTSNGSAWTSSAPSGAKGVDVQTFTSSGTWTKPSGYATNSRVLIQAWGGGAGGRNGTRYYICCYGYMYTGGSGGGGGGYNHRWVDLSDMGATETITIGAGGTAGNDGGNSTVGSLITAYGGYASYGGGQLAASNPFYQYEGTVSDNSSNFKQNANIKGGGGGSGTGSGQAFVAWSGGNSVWGGGGGGGATFYGAAYAGGSGGSSSYVGAGGRGQGNTLSSTAGTAPSGGGGGSRYPDTASSGAAGKVTITVFAGA